MECHARILGIVPVQCGEQLGSLGQLRHQCAECGFIAADPIVLQIFRRERLEDIGCGLAPLDDKRADWAKAMALRLGDDLA
jgi:hypothetical protein